jgi:hypothetical protein
MDLAVPPSVPKPSSNDAHTNIVPVLPTAH